MHYIIVITIIVTIVIIQLHSFVDTRQKIANFLKTFPKKKDEYLLSKEMLIKQIDSVSNEGLNEMLIKAGLNHETYHYTQLEADGLVVFGFHRKKAEKDLKVFLSTTANGISTNHKNETLRNIIDSINDYLQNNKSVSDFHLMKDIVDRNCDAKEEEINAQIPTPLYMGLVGTMAGILIGILYLWLSGGISNLLNANGKSGASSADGVEALLGGVALAMIASIVGIILTTLGSHCFKTAKSTIESDKHTFLSWIQAKLLPTFSDNVVGVIREMTGNLTEFNETFSSNVSNLDNALGRVNESYLLQTELLESVKQIADKNISLQNMQLYKALKNSATEIGTLTEHLHSSNEYLANVRALNEKLDLQENRTRIIEDVGAFFKQEVKEIEQRKAAVSKAVGTVDDYLKQALDKLKDNADTHFYEWQKASVKQQDALRHAVDSVDDHLIRALDKLRENADSKFSEWQSATEERQSVLKQTISTVDDYLKQTLDRLKESINSQFEEWQKATIKQQELSQWKPVEIDTIVSEFRNLTQALANMGNHEDVANEQNRKIDKLVDAINSLAAGGIAKSSMSGATKVLLLICGSIVSVACLSYIVPLFIQWITNH